MLKIQAEALPVFIDGALLGGGHVALAQNERFDAARVLFVLGIGLSHVGYLQCMD